jgi:carbonic anhydrase/acetyltransferase-like protein (isoleucine patch superfamily)
MNSTILHDVEIGDNSIIAAGCVVTEKMKIPNNSFVTGVPGKIKRTVTAEQLWWSKNSPSIYQELSQQYKSEGL